MTKEEAFKYWELFYQGKKEAFDYANILMKKEDYLNKKSKYGWAIDNKDNKTIALNQKETFLNTFPCSITSMNIRQGKQHFHINGREFNFAIDKKTKEKKLYEIKGREMKCVDPHQRLQERLDDKDNEKIMEIAGVKIKARQELNGNLVLVATDEEQLVTGLFSLADYIDKFKSKIKDNKNILVEIVPPLAKRFEIPKQIYISTETNRSEDILLFREMILNKNTTNFDYNESEHTLYCYDENQTRKEAFIKKKQMLKDEIYFLTIRIEGDKGLLSMFFSEEIDDDNEEEKAPEIDASFTFNLNKHDFTQELKKEETKAQEEPKQEVKEEAKLSEEVEEIIEEKEEEQPQEEEVLEEINEEIDQEAQDDIPTPPIQEEIPQEEEEIEEEKEEKVEPEEIEEQLQDVEEQEVEDSEETQEIVNEKYNHRFDTLLKINKEEIRRDLERLSFEKAKKEMKEEEEKARLKEQERAREKEEQEEQKKLKDYIGQENYKTKIFKKADLIKEERKEVEEVAKIVADDIEKKKQEKREQEERERKAYEEKLRLEEKAKQEEEERARLEEERIKEEERKKIEEELKKKNKEIQEEVQETDFIKITEELERQAIEENQENIESLGDLLEGDIPSQDQETTIQLEDEEENEETEKKRKEEIVAKQLFRKIYGDNAEKGKDFAGRTIAFSDYANYSSDTGWDYILLKDTFGIELENVVLANVQTLGEFKLNQKFESNGHTFYMTKVGEKNILQSDDVLINPFSYYEAKRLSNINKKTKKNLVYLYIKCTEYDGLSVQSEHFNIFVDFIQRSIYKMIITSLVKFEVGKDYIFISLDGDRNEAFEEAYNYAVLLNSYRKELKKDKIINAIIVLSSMETHHLNINKSSKDIALIDSTFKAIVEELSKKTIDPTIKRAIHIGPEVLNHLAVERNLLSKSRLIQNLVKEEYYECKFVYMLNREVF